MLDVSEVLKKVRRIEIIAKRAVNDLFAGQYKSVFRGRGMEFSEVREYSPGDDIRSIDWNVTARAGRPYIKRFVEERELSILFLVDISASGLFGSHRSKWETAVEAAAVLMFSALKNNDKVGLITFADKVIDFYRPRKGKANVLHLIRQLLSAEPIAEKTDLTPVLEYVNRTQKRRAVVFLISDFFVDELISDTKAPPQDKVLDSFFSSSHLKRSMVLQMIGKIQERPKESPQSRLLSLCNRRHDVIAMTLTDERESVFPDVGIITLQDAETGELVEVDTSSAAVRALMAKQFQVGRERIAAALRRSRIDQLEIGTNAPFLGDLQRFFHSREKRLH